MQRNSTALSTPHASFGRAVNTHGKVNLRRASASVGGNVELKLSDWSSNECRQTAKMRTGENVSLTRLANREVPSLMAVQYAKRQETLLLASRRRRQSSPTTRSVNPLLGVARRS